MARKNRSTPRNASHSSTRQPGGPALWDEPAAPAGLDENSEELADDQDADDDDSPKVVVALLRDLAGWIPSESAQGQPDRVAWFLSRSDAELVGIFDRHPEGPTAPPTARPILAGLREFCVDQGDRLQLYIGATESIEYGFHVDATLEQVVESFEDDGFEVIDAIRQGKVVIEDTAADEAER